MIRFNNDYNRAAHPAVLKALEDSAVDSFAGYGTDELCEKAADEVRAAFSCPDAAVHFLVGGTQVNVTAIAAALRPYQSAISPDTGHIHVHETGAVEHTGHKILTVPSQDGKITAEQVAQLGEAYRTSPIREHITQPKLVYISFPTEYGTVYTLRELTEMRAVCDKYGMYLFIDGARLGYGLAASDVTAKDLPRLADMFTMGGTKCGALFGEALVITNAALKPDFRSYIKQNGGMLAKGWLLGLQFDALLRDGLYFDICRRAVKLAMDIRAAFAAKGVPIFVDSPTNQQFVVLDHSQIEALESKYTFEPDHAVSPQHMCVRFCTSWATTDQEAAALIADIAAL